MQLRSINELNVWGFLLARKLGRPVRALCVLAYFPPLDGWLRRMVNATARPGDVAWAAAAIDELALFEKNPAEIEYADIYPRFEPAFNAIYGIDRIDIGDDTLAFRHAASSWLKFHLGKLVRLRRIADRLAAGDIRLAGLPRDLAACYAAVYGAELPGRRMPGTILNGLFNLAITALVLAATAWAVIKRTRIGADDTRRPFLLGADLSHEDARPFFLQIADQPGDVLFVARNPEILAALDAGARARYAHASLDDGRYYGATAALAALARAGRGLFVIYTKLTGMESGLYFSVAKLVLQHAKFRALFNRYALEGFIARDEYNSEHVVRSQELRRRGSISIGITHGMSTGPRVYPHTRYLDFDILYVFGNRQRDAYADTWPKSMTVKPIGAFRPTRRNWADVGVGRGNEIIIFGNQDTDPPAHADITRKIALAFPDRKVTIKLKYRRDYIGAKRYDPYLERLGQLPANVQLTDLGRPYDMMNRATYSFSGLSTVVAEAVQMGMVSFFIDVYRPDQDIFFRDFPELCVTSAEMAINRIRQIESGEWTYPRDAFADLIACPETNPFDAIRADLGMGPWPDDHEPALPATDRQEIRRVAL